MKLFKIFLLSFTFLILTILTQIGGIVFLISIFTHSFIDKVSSKKYFRITFKTFYFILLYLTFTFTLVPFIASPLGRVPLPVFEKNAVQPLSIITCLMNRHYVRPELRETLYETAIIMNKGYLKNESTYINYLDANFPFINKFPLIPHLSHNDGKKVDLAFCYKDVTKSIYTPSCPSSFMGYGICEEPLPGEINTAEICGQKGNWMYSFLQKITPQSDKKNFKFDKARTKRVIELIAFNESIGKIFIEPHLKDRLKLSSSKIKFHGCQAVRHDDHIHIQLK